MVSHSVKNTVAFNLHNVYANGKTRIPLQIMVCGQHILSKFPRNYVFLNHREERFPRPSQLFRGETELYADLLAKLQVFPWVGRNYMEKELLFKSFRSFVLVTREVIYLFIYFCFCLRLQLRNWFESILARVEWNSFLINAGYLVVIVGCYWTIYFIM